MPTAEAENRDRPTQRGEDRGARKADTNTNRNLETEDNNPDKGLPFDLQVAKAKMRDHGAMHEDYEKHLPMMCNPRMKKSMVKSQNAHADEMERLKADCEKCFPDHKIHDIDIPSRKEMRKSADSEGADEDDDEDEDEDEGDEDEGMDEKSLAPIIEALRQSQARIAAIDQRIKLEMGQ